MRKHKHVVVVLSVSDSVEHELPETSDAAADPTTW